MFTDNDFLLHSSLDRRDIVGSKNKSFEKYESVPDVFESWHTLREY